MNRARLLDTLVLAEAVAAAARAALVAEARHEWDENETRATWDMPTAKAVASIHQDSLNVVDHDVFMAWLREHYPTEVIEVTELRIRNAEWLKTMQEGWLAAIVAGTGDAPPGTKLATGGTFRTLSISIPADVKAELARRAALALAQGKVTLLGDPTT